MPSSTATKTTNSSSSTKRLLIELQSQPTPPSPALHSLHPISDTNLFHWTATLLGPTNTAYAHGRWKLDIRVPSNYPLAPPGIQFATRCCHPNVDFQTGEICLDLLRDHWSPAYTLVKTLEAVQQLLAYPQVDSPLNVDIANVLKAGDGMGGESLVRFWCEESRWEGG